MSIQHRLARRLGTMSLAASVLAAQAVLVAPLGVSPVAAGGTSLPACTAAQLKPELGDVAVNQGLNYPILNRGKQTLVRLFFRMPSTCSYGKTTISVSAASLSFELRDANGVVLTQTGVPSVLSPINAISGTLAATTQTNASTDPLFLFPGSYLHPADTVGAFSLRLAAITVTYKVSSASSAATDTPATVTSGPQIPYIAPFEPKTGALRLLIVPMGDASSPNVQFSDAARSAMQTAMSDLARMAPTPDGTGNLASTGTGVRYDFNSSLLDLGAGPNGLNVMSGGLFCGSQVNFDKISAGLAAMLNSYNAANPGFPADRAVGAIDAAISTGASGGCDEGRAAIPTASAAANTVWVRAIPDGTTPSPTGSVLAMELLHTFGGCVPLNAQDINDRCPLGTYHSRTTTDFSNGRGYNLATKTFLSTPPTVMHLGISYSTWNRTTTLYETNDYLLFSCVITTGFILPAGYTSIPGCATGGGTGVAPGSTGTNSGVPAGATYVLNGITDGKSTVASCPATRTIKNPVGDARYNAAGTSIYGSFNTDLQSAVFAITAPDTASHFRLRYFDQSGAQIDSDGTPAPNGAGIGVPVASTGDDGDHGSKPAPADASLFTFNVAFPFNAVVYRTELVKNDGNLASLADDRILFCANRLENPRLSPTALQSPSRLAFSRTDAKGVQNIWTSALDGSDVRQLTANRVAGLTVANPVWSPDGTAVLYTTSDPGDNIRIINADGTSDLPVKNFHTIAPARWSADGSVVLASKLATIGSAQVPSLFTVSPSAGGPGARVALATPMFGAVASPDGQLYFGSRADTTRPEIAYVPALADAPSATDLPMTTGATGSETVWSPDGTHVAYTITSGGVDQAFIGDVAWPHAIGGKTSVTNVRPLGPAGSRSPAFTADGATALYIAGGDAPGLHAVKLATGSDTVVVPGALNAGVSASIATPRPRLALVCANGGGICVENADGSGRQLISSGLGSYSGVTWSPTGKALAFTIDSGAHPGLYVVAPDGSGALPPVPASGAKSPDWSPDGRWIAFDNGSATLVAAPGSTRVTARLAGVLDPSWAPDSKHIVGDFSPARTGPINTTDTGLVFMAWNGTALSRYGGSGIYCLGGGPRTDCTDLTSLDTPDWSPDGKQIVANQVSNARGSSFAVGKVTTGLTVGRFSPVAFPVPPILPYSVGRSRWTPDGTGLTFSASRTNASRTPATDAAVWVGTLGASPTDRYLPSPGVPGDTEPVLGPTVPGVASVASPVPSDITMNVSYVCPNGQSFPVSVNVAPDGTTSGVADFFTGFNPSLACGGTGTLIGRAGDGFSLSGPVVLGTFTNPPKPPSADIDAPLDGAKYLPASIVTLSGRGTSPQGDTPVLTWTLARNSGTPVELPAGLSMDGGQSIVLDGATIPSAFRAAQGGWRAGQYTARLTATDSGGRHVTVSATFEVIALPIVSVTGVLQGATYVQGGMPSIGCSATDTGGGVGTKPKLTVAPLPAESPGAHTAKCSGATDASGHAARAAQVAYQVSALPTVTVSGPLPDQVYVLGSVPAVVCAVSSGPTVAPVTAAPKLTLSGGTDNGVGQFTATCSGTTALAPAGSPVPVPAPKPVTFRVKYAPGSGIVFPGAGSRDFSMTSTLPLRFTLPGAPSSSGFDTSAWQVAARAVDCDTGALLENVVPLAARSPSTFAYDAPHQRYQYNAVINQLTASTCWVARIALDDGLTTLTTPTFTVH